MRERLIKKAVLSRNFVFSNLKRLEEPFSLCTDCTDSLGQNLFFQDRVSASKTSLRCYFQMLLPEG